MSKKIILPLTLIGLLASSVMQSMENELENNTYALHNACRDGDLERSRLLIDSGADVNKKDEYGYTTLHYTALKNQIPLTQLLLEKSADPFAQITVGKSTGWTPLHVAASLNRKSICKDILANLGLFKNPEDFNNDKPNSSRSLQELVIVHLLSNNQINLSAILEHHKQTMNSMSNFIVQSLAEYQTEELKNIKFQQELAHSFRNEFIGEYYRNKLFELAQQLVSMKDKKQQTALEVVDAGIETRGIFKRVFNGKKSALMNMLTQVINAQNYSELPEEIKAIAEKSINKRIG